jgi:predicted transcriptional regulator
MKAMPCTVEARIAKVLPYRHDEANMPAPLMNTQVSVRLPNELKKRMETFARLTGRTKSYVAMAALTEYLALRIPPIEDLNAAVEAADHGDFAEDDEVHAVLLGTVPRVMAGRCARGGAQHG